MNTSAYLSSGFYSPRDAARLVGVSQTRIRGWIRGYAGTDAAPIISNDFSKLDDHLALSFVNLIEALFIAHFSKEGIHVRAIRNMAEEAKRLLNNPHPFATEHFFKTDGHSIFAEIVEKVGDQRLSKLYNLRRHNYAFHSMLKDAFRERVVYGPEGYAHLWYPRKKRYPNVLINPNVAFGKPVMADSGIPTETLYDAYRAEQKNYRAVSKIYKTKLGSVQEAVNFERALTRTA